MIKAITVYSAVTLVLPKVVPGVEKELAIACYRTSEIVGRATIIVLPKEHAEMYCYLLHRCKVASIIEPESDLA